MAELPRVSNILITDGVEIVFILYQGVIWLGVVDDLRTFGWLKELNFQR